MRNGGFGGPAPHQPELKVIDQNIDTQLLNNATGNEGGVTGWTKILLNPCVQGTDMYTRIGRKIIMQKWILRLEVLQSNVASTSGGAGHVRVLVVYDAQTNAAIPVITDILGATATGSAAPDMTTPMNLNNRERFRLLMDKVFYIGAFVNSAVVGLPATPGFSNMAQSFVKKFKQNMKLDVVFNNGNAGTQGDIQTGGIWMFFATTVECSAANGAPLINGVSRIRFYDA